MFLSITFPVWAWVWGGFGVGRRTRAANSNVTLGCLAIHGNRVKYFSALKRQASVDNYVRTIVPVNCPPGLISFEAGEVATEAILKSVPHIKDVEDLLDTSS